MVDVLRLTSLQIREIADFAQSVRGIGGNPVFMVTTADEGRSTFRLELEMDHSPCADEYVVPVPASTFTQQPARRTVEEVEIRAAGMPNPESLKRYDAVFWSEAAVEKFVLPYYASKYQWAAAHVLSVLSKVFYGFVPTPAGVPKTAPGEVPFAVAHIPRSDYAAVDPPGTFMLGHDLAILFTDDQGNVTHRRLAEFL